jgi:hypothetical protein
MGILKGSLEEHFFKALVLKISNTISIEEIVQ